MSSEKPRKSITLFTFDSLEEFIIIEFYVNSIIRIRYFGDSRFYLLRYKIIDASCKNN